MPYVDLVAPVARYDISNQDIAPSVEHTIRYYDRDYAQVNTLCEQIHGVELASDTTFYWSEQQAVKFAVELEGTISSEAADVKQVATFKTPNVVVGDCFYEMGTKQTFRVYEFVSRDTVAGTVTHMIGREGAALTTSAVTGTVTLYYGSNKITENGYYPIGKGQLPTWYYNYIQTITNVVGISKTNKKIPAYWGDQLSKYMWEAHQQHQYGKAFDLYFGVAVNELAEWTNEDGFTSDGQIRHSQGIDARIATHSTSYGGTMTESTFNQWLSDHVWSSRNAGDLDRVLAAGPGLQQQLNSFAVNRMQTYPLSSVYGINLKQYITWGDHSLTIVGERVFYDNPTWKNSGIAISLDDIRLRGLGNYMTESYPISLPNKDSEAWVYRTEYGYEIMSEMNFAKIYKS